MFSLTALSCELRVIMPASPVRYAFSSGRNPAAAIHDVVRLAFHFHGGRIVRVRNRSSSGVRLPAVPGAGRGNWGLSNRGPLPVRRRHCRRNALVATSTSRQVQGSGIADRARRAASSVCGTGEHRRRAARAHAQRGLPDRRRQRLGRRPRRAHGNRQPARDGTGLAAALDPDRVAVPRRAGA